MKIWILRGDVLEIAEGENRIPASAEEVYQSVLEGGAVWQDLIPGKTGAAQELSFSRYPIVLKLRISADEITGKPTLSTIAQTHIGASFPISNRALERGHVVHDGTWYPAAPGAAEGVIDLMREVGYTDDGGMPPTLRGILHLKKIASEGGPVVDELGRDALKYLLSEPERAIGPESIRAQLYPYQCDGWRWLGFIIREQLGGLLADEMGLGKTLQIISALRDPGGNGAAGAALVIAPGSLLENWVREIAKFSPDLTTYKHQGSSRTGRPADLQGVDVVVTSYDTVTRDLSLLKMIEWNVVILDEAQNIRNPKALRTKSVKEINRRVGLAVTGTPVENRLLDLWSIMDFVVPGYLGDLEEFEARYSDDLDAAASLEPLISPLMLRRRVADVATDLPQRIDIPEFLEMSEHEATAYEVVRQEIFQEYGAAANLVSLGKLRQFCAHPGAIEGYGSDINLSFSKFERLKELFEEIFSRGEKALVFTSYTKIADLIREMAAARFQVLAATLDGRLAIDERQGLIDGFSAHVGPAVLVLNPRAGGSGLNITAANHVIHYNPEWNPALEDQASARAYRRGQQLPVTVRSLIYAGTVEEVIAERLKRKRHIAEAAIIGSGGQDEDYADILGALERSPLARRTE
ncbi:DEAD/DEAH box helicase [Marinobacter subterrani]|uniref:Helicase conserved C-terminal domain/SNF2 family N-terminal domain n=1 Tax=Marinobacter subterrani TaxID=1658765 RepID=A0A0J7JER0_9GAMM|nr:DEAD/DEAH box helicase [Marinobacter subterrani]KMQ76389.1 Helicase conserved C-terminal domain/SNF2 family N-terminal domain [Marinobacter subterrani]